MKIFPLVPYSCRSLRGSLWARFDPILCRGPIVLRLSFVCPSCRGPAVCRGPVVGLSFPRVAWAHRGGRTCSHHPSPRSPRCGWPNPSAGSVAQGVWSTSSCPKGNSEGPHARQVCRGVSEGRSSSPSAPQLQVWPGVFKLQIFVAAFRCGTERPLILAPAYKSSRRRPLGLS